MSLPHPFTSSRLSYRAIRSADIAIFSVISADIHGFQNSNFANISLPSESDTCDFKKNCSNTEKYLLGMVIWLNHPEGTTKEAIKKLKQESEFGEAMVEEWGTAIGELHLSRLAPTSSHHRWTEVGLGILPAYQNRGFGREAITWALDYAFRRAGLHRVRIRAFGWNEGAIRLYERIGFKHEGREREAYWHEGRWWDGVEMSMLEEEWKELNEKAGDGATR